MLVLWGTVGGVLTVQARSSVVYHTLLGVGVLNGGVIIRNKVGLQGRKQVCLRQAHTGHSLREMLKLDT